MDLIATTTFGPVLCRKCGNDSVEIISEATHTSEGVYHGDSGYVAYNSDTSWQCVDGSEKFRCSDCSETWAVDKNIWWEWND